MTAAFTPPCDCGLPRIRAKTSGIYKCSHCDTGGCSGHCIRCARYRRGIVQRIIIPVYDGRTP